MSDTLNGAVAGRSCPCGQPTCLMRILLQTLVAAHALILRAWLQACSEERVTFCSDVTTGHARVFRCLTQNLGDSDFGSACRDAILGKLARRQQNWKLDVNLREACTQDANSACAEVDHNSDKAETMRCMMRKHDELGEDCRAEVHRSSLQLRLRLACVWDMHTMRLMQCFIAGS